MQMAGDPGPRGLSNVDPHIEAPGMEGLPDDPFTFPEEPCHFAEGFKREIPHRGAVRMWNDHQVATGVGKGIHDDIAERAAKENEPLPGHTRGGNIAQEASSAGAVLDSPRM